MHADDHGLKGLPLLAPLFHLVVKYFPRKQARQIVGVDLLALEADKEDQQGNGHHGPGHNHLRVHSLKGSQKQGDHRRQLHDLAHGTFHIPTLPHKADQHHQPVDQKQGVDQPVAGPSDIGPIRSEGKNDPGAHVERCHGQVQDQKSARDLLRPVVAALVRAVSMDQQQVIPRHKKFHRGHGDKVRNVQQIQKPVRRHPRPPHQPDGGDIDDDRAE